MKLAKAFASMMLLETMFGCSVSQEPYEIYFPSQKQEIQVSGGSWFGSNILRGLKIKVCPESIKPEIESIRSRYKDAWKIESQKSLNEMSSLQDGSGRVGEIINAQYTISFASKAADEIEMLTELNSNCVVKAETDIDGKYNFTIEDLQHQPYFIYASPFSGKVDGYYFWDEPVPIDGSKRVQINLSEQNIKKAVPQFPDDK